MRSPIRWTVGLLVVAAALLAARMTVRPYVRATSLDRARRRPRAPAPDAGRDRNRCGRRTPGQPPVSLRSASREALHSEDAHRGRAPPGPGRERARHRRAAPGGLRAQPGRERVRRPDARAARPQPLPDHGALDRHARRRGAVVLGPDAISPGATGSASSGISFAGGLSVVAAGRPSLARPARVRVLVRRPCELPAGGPVPVLRRASRPLPGIEQCRRRSRRPTTTAWPSSRSTSPESSCRADQVEPLKAGILTFLHASHLALFDREDRPSGSSRRRARRKPRWANPAGPSCTS